VLIEAVVSESHQLVDRSIKEGKFRSNYGAVILAISRNGERIKQKIGDIVLKPGDTLFLEGDSSFASRYKNSNEFYLVSPMDGVHRSVFEKSGIALIIVIGMVFLAAMQILSMFQAVLLASAGMIITRALSYPNAIKSIDWRLLIAIGSAIGIGVALVESGVISSFISLVSAVSISKIYFILFVIFFSTWVLTELITNAAAAVLMFPLVKGLSESFDLNLIPLVIVMLVASSASFATPIGYQTNLMMQELLAS